MPNSRASKSPTPSIKPPHLTLLQLADSVGSPYRAFQSQRSGGISDIQSRPANKLSQKSSSVGAIGKRPLTPTIAIASGSCELSPVARRRGAIRSAASCDEASAALCRPSAVAAAVAAGGHPLLRDGGVLSVRRILPNTSARL